MGARKWTDEQRKQMSEKKKASWQERNANRFANSPHIAGVEEKPVPVKVSKKLEEPTPEAPPKNLFSGDVLKLQVFGKSGDPLDPIPGYKLYWFNDVAGGLRIAQARSSGWQHVMKNEIAISDEQLSPGNTDLGSNVRRWVGESADGNQVHAYLMKKPNWLYDLHQNGPDSIEQRIHQKIEQQLLGGTFDQQPGEMRYNARSPYPGSQTNLPPISIRHPKYNPR